MGLETYYLPWEASGYILNIVTITFCIVFVFGVLINMSFTYFNMTFNYIIFCTLIHDLQLYNDFVCLYTYEFWLSLCKIVRSSIILLLPFLTLYIVNLVVSYMFFLFCFLLNMMSFQLQVLIIRFVYLDWSYYAVPSSEFIFNGWYETLTSLSHCDNSMHIDMMTSNFNYIL